MAGLDPIDQPERETRWRRFAARLDDALVPRVVAVNRLTPTIVEVVVRAPFAAERIPSGAVLSFTKLRIELAARIVGILQRGARDGGIALTGAWHDPEKGSSR